jgi:hypothetical protein
MPNPCSKRQPQSFVGNLLQQVSGKADVTTNKNGILISKEGKEGKDLIDEALRYNGTLPELTTPEAPTQRSKPTGAQPSASTSSPAPAAIKP